MVKLMVAESSMGAKTWGYLEGIQYSSNKLLRFYFYCVRYKAFSTFLLIYNVISKEREKYRYVNEEN